MKEDRYSLQKKTRCLTALDLIKCLKQIKENTLLLTSVPTSELPSLTMYNVPYWHFLSPSGLISCPHPVSPVNTG